MNIRQMLQKLKRADGDTVCEIIEEYQYLKMEKNDFADWWHGCGSGLAPMDGEDKEEHTKRVCEAFYLHLLGDA